VGIWGIWNDSNYGKSELADVPDVSGEMAIKQSVETMEEETTTVNDNQPIEDSIIKQAPVVHVESTSKEDIALQRYVDIGFTPATPDNLFVGVKVYSADSPDKIHGHEFTILGFGNDGLMKDYVYVSDIILNGEEKWIHVDELTEGIIEFHGDWLAYLVRLDDPAIAEAKRTIVPSENDNFVKVERFRTGMELYILNSATMTMRPVSIVTEAFTDKFANVLHSDGKIRPVDLKRSSTDYYTVR
jgi:hypothetical protein